MVRLFVLLMFLFPASPVSGLWQQQPDKATTPQSEQPAAPAETLPAGTAPANANEPVPDYDGFDRNKPVRETSKTGIFLNMIGSLMLVLGLIVAMAWLTKKFFPDKLGLGRSGDHLRLLQSMPLGPKRFVTLIEADGKRFLLGVTEHNINLIKCLDELPFNDALTAVEDPKTVQELWEGES